MIRDERSPTWRQSRWPEVLKSPTLRPSTMTGRYQEMVRHLVADADRRAATDADQRVNKGVALAALLTGIGFSYKPTAVRSWIRGDTKPPPDVLLAVAE